MQKFVLVLVAFFQVVGGVAQGRFNGRVLGEADMPLLAVNVVLGDDHAFGTSTDADGRFTLNIGQSGSHRLRLSHVGYTMIDTMISSGTNEDLSLIHISEPTRPY